MSTFRMEKHNIPDEGCRRALEALKQTKEQCYLGNVITTRKENVNII